MKLQIKREYEVNVNTLMLYGGAVAERYYFRADKRQLAHKCHKELREILRNPDVQHLERSDECVASLEFRYSR